MGSLERTATMDKSKGHIAFIAQFEYFTGPQGDLFRAHAPTTYIGPNGYRTGARWQCPASMAESMMVTLRNVKAAAD